MKTQKQSNKDKVFYAICELLKGGEKNITRYGIAKHSGVERSQVYSIIDNFLLTNKG